MCVYDGMEQAFCTLLGIVAFIGRYTRLLVLDMM